MHKTGRTKRFALGSTVALTVAGMNAPAVLGFANDQYHNYVINQPGYKAEYGHWQTLGLPAEFRVNAVHATVLRTGKVLIVAGSGNDEKQFNAGTFKSLLWDPAANTYKLIPTPADMFCGGHTSLPDGRVLVAGGTARYEKLDGAVKKAGGVMRVRNESPDRARSFPKGTVFVAPNGREYASTADVTVPAATKSGAGAQTRVTAGETRVFVEALGAGQDWVSGAPAQYRIKGLAGADAHNLYGQSAKITLDKQEYQGIRSAFEFNPDTELYEQVTDMAHARWYPTLTGLGDGRVVTVSGLDDTGEILNGNDNEIYDPKTRTWAKGPDRYFPTYPSIFLTANGKLFYSGSNAGYGPADKGRQPGVWNLADNSFQPVPGLRDQNLTETSSSVLLPPAQSQKVMLLGGGGVGESPLSTARTDIADLSAAQPVFTPGPDLPAGGTRYLNSVILPDDTVFTTGGSSGYRGRGDSDLLKAQVYHPDSNTFKKAAEPTVGRDYHSEAVLLPDGRVAVLGSNPLFADKAETQPGGFEQRIEIYTPPYLYHGDRPQVTDAPGAAKLGGTVRVGTARPEAVATAKLIRPSSVTHATDVEQRSVALDITGRTADGVSLALPANPNLLPPGWYMLFLTDGQGTPSVARWVEVKA
ncbi:galactose oxidase [Streptomyces rubellomurinus subsp. indigoferus]|uniref:Galactose oxidase n=2 Tax=Streptomyces rubellomurinus (strain ATCC 31215) TaxID=359131 RepID=A0A0F2TBQ7_STRR3|nr:galactose oxidase [Streptomyces rubellomurinus subsp. indigoferus]KJS60633.1 galactose oxidase [Streptomyces rubellomurinus]